MDVDEDGKEKKVDGDGKEKRKVSWWKRVFG